MAEKGIIRLDGEGGAEVALVREFLLDFERAYNSLLGFEEFLGERNIKRMLYPPIYPPIPRFGFNDISLVVPINEALALRAVQLSSPGFWEFMGTLNPLEVIRKYLQDRHERRKDKSFRETAERRRLELENLQLENSVISERIKIAKEMGATDRDLAPIVRQLVTSPLRNLDKYQDGGLIGGAERREEKPY